MCGICGLVDLGARGVQALVLQVMNDKGAHRGPDGAGVALFRRHGAPLVAERFNEEPAGDVFLGLGHRRLSILDLSEASRQPMFHEDGSICVVYNGEIYNFKELRGELESLGHDFHTTGDTEVLLKAYRQWGGDCLTRFNGMWAFALYDSRSETLFCARDRFGIKPFYYRLAGDRLAFASEIKQLVQSGEAVAEVNREIAGDFFLWSFESHTSDTFFAGVHSLPPSHFFVIDLKPGSRPAVTPKRYWIPEPGETHAWEKGVERFRELLQSAVDLRLRSDVPVGIKLSGGLDSSSIARLSALSYKGEGIAQRLQAFTSVYDDIGYSETKFSEQIAVQCDMLQHKIYPRAHDLPACWGAFIWHMEEPFGGLSYFSNWKVMERARAEGVPVILNGQGGDELLLGYDRYRLAFLRILLDAGRYKNAWREMQSNRANGNMPLFRQLQHYLYFNHPAIRIRRRANLMHRYLRKSFFASAKTNQALVRKEFEVQDLNDLQVQEFYGHQLQHLLRHEDRISMAFSIEARIPFMDYRLFNFMLSQTESFRLNSGWSKLVLRKAMEGRIPHEVAYRRDKMGFATPTQRLIVANRPFFLELVKRHRNDELLDCDAILQDFDRINENNLCRFLSYLAWKEQFIQ